MPKPYVCLLMSLIGLVATPAALAQKATLSPAKVKQIKKTRKSFENCRKDALSQLKQGTVSKKKFEVMLSACKENFPGASLYIGCKKAAIRAAQSKNVTPDEAVRQCQRYLTAASFDPTEPLPVFVDKGQVFFAGIGLNRPTPASSLNPPNFDCAKLQDVVRNPKQAQYFLFGNHPRVFAGLAEKKGPDLLKTLQITKPSAKGVDAPGFGRVFNDPAKGNGMSFFPSASCDFDTDPGDVFAGLSAYYLLDSASSSVTPYFGIAYYKQGQSATTTKKLVQSMMKALGTNFKPIPKNALTTFVTAAGVSETDEEKDPKNLCLQPRQHRFVGVIQGRKDDPAQPEYMLLANIKNLCDFGDKLSKRLTR